MPNYRDWTASEIIAQLPAARNLLAMHFGPESVGSSSGAQLSELAKRKGVDMSAVTRDLNALAPRVQTAPARARGARR